MLKTQNLSYQYPNQKKLVFKDIELSTANSLLITGESGKGKSTLLHLLSGFLKPREGSIIISKTEISKLKEPARDQFRGQHIGIVTQNQHFVESLSVYENIEFHGWLGKRKKVPKAGILNILNQMDILDLADELPGNLSVGQRQRAGIARALINKPKMILADEPTSNLDDKNTNKVANLLLESVQEANSSLVVVTHDKRLKPYFKNQIELL